MAEPRGPVNPLFLRAESLQRGVDLLALAARELGEADAALRSQYGLGGAEARLLLTLRRCGEPTMGQLTAILGISKQALHRSLAGVKARGWASERPGRRDRRHKHIRLTAGGAELAEALARRQRARLAEAYRAADATAVAGFTRVLDELVGEPERRALLDEDAGP